MPPVSRAQARASAPSRRAATAPAQQRRNAAAAPTRRRAAEAEPEEATAFDAAEGNADEPIEDEDLPEVIDLSEVQATTYEVVPRGRYQGYVDSVDYGLSQASGAPMLTWILKFDYGEDANGDPKERTIRFYTTLTGDGAGRTKATLARLDPDLDFSTFAPGDADEMFGGLDVMISIRIQPDREDRKIKRNNVQDIYPLEEE